ncbi:MAG: hypothetical protein M3Z02_13250 [Actinomycetota bacterium]|nr:hypothetical protein [Actinomycetota bacterium]
MQGTVRSYSVETRAGSVLLDDGTEMEFDRSAFDASGLRRLRVGQRVKLELVGDRVSVLSGPTLPR